MTSLLHGYCIWDQWGGRIFDDDWNSTINAPEALKATEFLRRVFRTGPENMETFSFGQSTFDVLSGRAAIYLDNLNVGAALRDPSFSALSENISFVGHPRDKACSAETGGFAIGIPENSENKEAAFLLLQYLTSKEGDRRTLNFANSWMGRDTTTLLLCSNVLSAQGVRPWVSHPIFKVGCYNGAFGLARHMQQSPRRGVSV